MRSPIPALVRSLGALDGILRKGERFCVDNGIDASELLEARIAPTMKPLTHQIRLCCNHAVAAATLLADKEALRIDGAFDTFLDLHARIAATRAAIGAIAPEAFDATDQSILQITLDDGVTSVPACDYLMEHAMPNFYFSMTTAYNILRGKGVPLGKTDFLGGVTGNAPNVDVRPAGRSPVSRPVAGFAQHGFQNPHGAICDDFHDRA